MRKETICILISSMLSLQEFALLDKATEGREDGKAETDDLLTQFAQSKSGWRKTPTTALRQQKQLSTMFEEARKRCGTANKSVILRHHLDTIESLLLEKLPQHSAQVKSCVIALLEFSRYVSVREAQNGAEWDASIRRLEVWKRDATYMDAHRQGDVQDRMSDESYLPSKEELTLLRKKCHDALEAISKTSLSRRDEAVKCRRLITTAILMDNFQRTGTIKNATMSQYNNMSDGIVRVHEHKSRSSYGSANLVVSDIETYLKFYVENARRFLVKDDGDTALFPSSHPLDDMGEDARCSG